MGHNTLSTKERTKWRSLYRAGWRCRQVTNGGFWYVIDEQERRRSHGHPARWLAVAEVVAS